MNKDRELSRLAARIYAETQSGKKVAVRLNVSQTTAYRLLHEAGVVLPDRHGPEVNERKRKLNDDAATLLAKDYSDGLPMPDLQAKYGVGDWAIREAVKRVGGQIRSRGGALKTFADEHLDEAKRLYEGGLSQAQIAASFGMGLATVNRALRMAGVNIRAAKARGSAHGSWKGGRVYTSEGYIRVLVGREDPLCSMADNMGYALEHRLVMARALDRPLTKHETVHHIDGDRSNNKLSNLQLRFGKHGTGVAMVCAKCGSRAVTYAKLATAD